MSLRQLFSLSIGLSAVAILGSGCNEAQSQQKEKDAAHAHPAPAAMLPPSPTPRPENATLYIISPKDGDTVSGTFTVQFGLKGMGVAPAAVFVNAETPTGHHHLIIDAELPIMEIPFPKDDNYRHFGGGQTEAEITLPAGKHTLQLVLGDHNHVPHKPALVSRQITVTVK